MKLFWIIGSLIYLYSCSTPRNEDQEGEAISQTIEYSDLEGYWLQEGYGVYLEIRDSIYKMYDITEISCQPSVSGSINHWTDSLSVLMDLYSFEEFNSKLLLLKYGITTYKFKRLSKPLEICDTPIVASDDPELNFDIFWHTFKENYAYSEIRGVDWDQIYDDTKPLISQNITQVQLYRYIKKVIDSIQDEHISLRVPNDITEAYLATVKADEWESVADPVKQQSEYDQDDYTTLRNMARENILKLYNSDNFKRYNKDLIVWGCIKSNVGYVQVNGMNGYSQNNEIPDSLPSVAYWEAHWNKIFDDIKKGKTIGQYLREELKGVNTVLDSVFSELSTTSMMIIDLRFNPGGTDKVALDILSRFTNKPKKLFTKRVRTGESKFYDSEVYVHPTTNAYTEKVMLLIGPQTGSSAETMVLGSLCFDSMVKVGSNTLGIFSDVLQKQLPNGWRFGLSNEVYETESKKNYEHTGIPPDIEIQYSKDWRSFFASLIELKEVDPAIEKAISLVDE